MQTLRFLFSTVIACLITSSLWANSEFPARILNDKGEAHYLTSGTFLFDLYPNPNGGGRVYHSYVPENALVYEIPLPSGSRRLQQAGLSWLNPPNRAKFGLYLTQFGSIGFIKRSVVSASTYTNDQGSLNLTTLREFSMCEAGITVRCADVQDEDRIDVPMNWFGLVTSGRFETELSFFPKNAAQVNGVLDATDFEELKSGGALFHMTPPVPEFAIVRRREVVPFRKDCGSTVNISDIAALRTKLEGGFSPGFLRGLLGINYSAQFEQSVKRTTSYEAGNEAVRFFEFKILTADETGAFDSSKGSEIAATVVYACNGDKPANDAIVVKSVTIAGQNGVFRSSHEVKAEEVLGKAIDAKLGEEIWRRNREAPFLFSINDRAAYDLAIDNIQTTMDVDARLANLFLALFNASCESPRRRCLQITR